MRNYSIYLRRADICDMLYVKYDPWCLPTRIPSSATRSSSFTRTSRNPSAHGRWRRASASTVQSSTIFSRRKRTARSATRFAASVLFERNACLKTPPSRSISSHTPVVSAIPPISRIPFAVKPASRPRPGANQTLSLFERDALEICLRLVDIQTASEQDAHNRSLPQNATSVWSCATSS